MSVNSRVDSKKVIIKGINHKRIDISGKNITMFPNIISVIEGKNIIIITVAGDAINDDDEEEEIA